MIHQGDSLEVLKDMETSSVDSLVTDPPAGISFMGKEWDDDKGGRDQWVSWMSEVMRECLRVLKPGGHALVWAIPRTSHWTATALEDAGFEIRDVITHLFGSGFPKSMDISKAIDKAAGAEREVVGRKSGDRYKYEFKSEFEDRKSGSCNLGKGDAGTLTAPATDAAKTWQGWGTALKPASEHWILCRKPLSEKTVAANVLKHGTGGINIDGCRIETQDNLNGGAYSGENRASKNGAIMRIRGEPGEYQQPSGRFPANLVLSHDPECVHIATRDAYACTPDCPVRMLDAQSGVLKSGAMNGFYDSMGYLGNKSGRHFQKAADSGGASRFFYVAKPSKRERNAGCEGLPEVKREKMASSGRTFKDGEWIETHSEPLARQNHHPTVKPVKLMAYLIRMITPPGGLVLDPFTGSGTTGVAAVQEGFRFVGIEREAEYVQIAQARIEAAHA